VSLLQAENITKAFGDKLVLNNISIECKKGEILGIFGRNGTGKSSLLKIIFGTLKYDNGSLKIDKNSYSQKKVIPNQQISYFL